jgi:hypothetical protein
MTWPVPARDVIAASRLRNHGVIDATKNRRKWRPYRFRPYRRSLYWKKHKIAALGPGIGKGQSSTAPRTQ